MTCNCDVVPGEIRESKVAVDPVYAIRSHTNTWIVISLVRGNGYISHDHLLDDFIDTWPVVYRPE